MTLKSIKQEVYHLTSTKNTKQFSQKYSHLAKGKDLRDKAHWLDILEPIKLLREQSLDISLKDLEDSEKMLKESLFTVGRMGDLNDEKIEIDWQRIQLETNKYGSNPSYHFLMKSKTLFERRMREKTNLFSK